MKNFVWLVVAFVAGCSLFERRPSELPPPVDTASQSPAPSPSLAPQPPIADPTFKLKAQPEESVPVPTVLPLPSVANVPSVVVTPAAEASSTPAGKEPVLPVPDSMQSAPVKEIKFVNKSQATHEYVVQKGDTLFSIARRFFGSGFAANSLYELNALKPGDQLTEGQVLKLSDPKDNGVLPHAKGELRKNASP